MIDQLFEKCKKWVIGENLDQGLTYIQQYQNDKIYCIINCLGENERDDQDIIRNRIEYLKILSKIEEHNFDAMISIKPTQFGLYEDPGSLFSFIKYIEPVIERCNDLGIRICIDMESPELYYMTILAFHYFLDKYSKNYSGSNFLRIAIQADVISSPDDIKRIIEKGGSVRLCKGAYDKFDSKQLKRYTNKEDIINNFITCAEILSKSFNRSSLATHDSKLLDMIEQRIGLNKFDMEYLYGYPPTDDKIHLYNSIYLPYGDKWLSYCKRRDPTIEKNN